MCITQLVENALSTELVEAKLKTDVKENKLPTEAMEAKEAVLAILTEANRLRIAQQLR
tara:strand:- start:361 stop:534 length:174 start_codon:yes stop_codon:yes gene_type:complete